MDWQGLLAHVAPGLAARRLMARARLAMAQRFYDSIATNYTRPRRGSSASADAVMDNAQARLREYARWLDDNHDLAAGVLDDLVSNIIGTGCGIEPMVANAGGEPIELVNRQLRQLWRDWWAAPETTGEIPGPELERIVCRTWLRDGEVFLQHSTSPMVTAESTLGYLLTPLEADYVPFDLIDADARTVHGVVKDAMGRPRAYHVYKTHPGHSGVIGQWGTSLMPETVLVGANNMIHLKFTRRLHQTRGASLLHAVFTRLDDLKDYEESERVAARVAAAFTAYIRKPEGFDLPTDADTGDRMMTMAPGMIFDKLLPGEDVGTIDAKRPNNDVDQFITIQERRIAAGTGSRASAVGRNYNGTYSAQRQELVEGAVHYRRLHSYLVHRFYRPIWQRFVDATLLKGLLTLTPSVDAASLYACEVRPPSLPWIDPSKEITAHALAVENGFRARHQVIRDLGGDPREVDTLLAADPLDVRPSVDSPSAGPAANPSDDASDETADDNAPQQEAA